MSKILFFLLLGVSTPSYAVWDCLERLDKLITIGGYKADIVSIDEDIFGKGRTGIKIDGIAVTGEDVLYPLSLVKENLGLGGQEIKDLEGQKIISIGEGFSGLLPHLLENGISVKGLDLWYHADDIPQESYVGGKMIKYIEQYGEHLIQGDAKQMPFDDNIYDVVLSHQLVNNFLPHDALVMRDSSRIIPKIIDEVLRVLKPGGEARIFGVGESIESEYLIHNAHRIESWEMRKIENKWGDGYLLILRKPKTDSPAGHYRR